MLVGRARDVVTSPGRPGGGYRCCAHVSPACAGPQLEQASDGTVSTDAPARSPSRHRPVPRGAQPRATETLAFVDVAGDDDAVELSRGGAGYLAHDADGRMEHLAEDAPADETCAVADQRRARSSKRRRDGRGSDVPARRCRRDPPSRGNPDGGRGDDAARRDQRGQALHARDTLTLAPETARSYCSTPRLRSNRTTRPPGNGTRTAGAAGGGRQRRRAVHRPPASPPRRLRLVRA